MANFTPQQIEEFLQEFFDVVGARQYVGARYVPIFGRAGEDTVEWDNGAPYEPLTVVMHEGVSYVSRRYVPRGIQITDTAYWVETYRFNAQVEQYRREVLSFDERIQANAAAIQGEAEARQQADDDVLMRVHDEYVPFPDPETYPKYGTTGQVLSTLEDGATKWEDPVTVDADIAEPLIEAWLDDHPEATTTVQDGSITYPKFSTQVSNTNTRVMPPPRTRVYASDSGNVATGMLTDDGYFDVSLVVNNVAGFFVMSLWAFPIAGYLDKKLSIIVELISGAGNINVRLGASSDSDWSPSANPLTLLETTLSSNNPIAARTITPSDVYTPRAGQGLIGFWLGISPLAGSGITTGTYRFRFYLVENTSSHTVFADMAATANVSTTANTVADSTIHLASLDDAMRDTLSRVIIPFTTVTGIENANNSISSTVKSNGYIEASANIVTNAGYLYVTLCPSEKYGYFKDKNVTIVAEFDGIQPFGSHTIYLYMSQGTDWSPTNHAKLVASAFYTDNDRRIAVTARLADLADSNWNDSSTCFFILRLPNLAEGLNTGTLKIRYYAIVNDVPSCSNEEDVNYYAINFWGDSLTVGSGGGGTTFPAVCSNILGVHYRNLGVGGENGNTIAARQGGNNLVIPAGAINGTYAASQMLDIFGIQLSPLIQGSGGNSGNALIVNGYECSLSVAQVSGGYQYTISGYTGPSSPIPVLARFKGSEFTSDITVIWIGTNGAQAGTDGTYNGRIAIIDSMIAHTNSEKCVVMGLSRGAASDYAADDQAMLEHYGSRFFPTRKMLIENGLALEGITPTSQDTTDIANGVIPTSLRSDEVHLNQYGYDALGKMMAQKIQSLDYL